MEYQCVMATLTSSHTDLQPKMSGFLAHIYHQDKKCNFGLPPSGAWCTAEGTTWPFSLLLCAVCHTASDGEQIYSALDAPKKDAGNEYADVEHLVHKKTLSEPLVVRGSFIPSRIISIYPFQTLFFVSWQWRWF